MHDETPNAAGPELEIVSGRGEAVRPPPLREMFWLGPGGKDQRARRIELARANDRARIRLKIETA